MKVSYKSLLTKEQLGYNLCYALRDIIKDKEQLDKVSKAIMKILTNYRYTSDDLSEEVKKLRVELEAANMSNFFKDAQIAQLKEENTSLAKDVLEQVGQQRDEYVLFKEQQWFVDICRRFGVDPKNL